MRPQFARVGGSSFFNVYRLNWETSQARFIESVLVENPRPYYGAATAQRCEKNKLKVAVQGAGFAYFVIVEEHDESE